MAEEKKEDSAANAEEQEIEETAAEMAEEKAEAVDTTGDKQEEKPQKTGAIKDLNYFVEVRKDLPEIKPGDGVRVSYRVIEGGKERIQVFEGTVIAIKNSGVSKTITVRKTSFGIAVERIFPLNSTLVQGIEVSKHSKVRRAKLYYLRNLKGKAARLRELR
jgi:large subunit ribosomal protein L19